MKLFSRKHIPDITVHLPNHPDVYLNYGSSLILSGGKDKLGIGLAFDSPGHITVLPPDAELLNAHLAKVGWT